MQKVVKFFFRRFLFVKCQIILFHIIARCCATGFCNSECCSCQGECLTLLHNFQIMLFNSNFNGVLARYWGDRTKCTNLIKKHRNKIDSVDTMGNCFDFYSELNCQGNSTKISPDNNDINQYNSMKFQSFKKC